MASTAEAAQLNSSFGDRLADRVARVGGSWSFIIAFGLVLATWMLLNSRVLQAMGMPPFDAYPFIFLNLLLSTLAAVQAPVIMMSQNRQSAKDRVSAQHDYEVNLRTQLEILRLSVDRPARQNSDARVKGEETTVETGKQSNEKASGRRARGTIGEYVLTPRMTGVPACSVSTLGAPSGSALFHTSSTPGLGSIDAPILTK